MLLNERLYTADEFWELCQLPENAEKHWELIEGVIYEMSPTVPRHGYIAILLAHKLMTYLDEHDLGVILGTDVGFRLTPQTLCSPDLAFVGKHRSDAKRLIKFADYAPDIAVEVISPSNTQSEINQKTKLYLQHGTRLVWIVYPDQKEVHVYRAEDHPNKASITFLGVEDTLSGEDVLPNFEMPLAKLFQD
jgi:Uma2 family endonuclease